MNRTAKSIAWPTADALLAATECSTWEDLAGRLSWLACVPSGSLSLQPFGYEGRPSRTFGVAMGLETDDLDVIVWFYEPSSISELEHVAQVFGDILSLNKAWREDGTTFFSVPAFLSSMPSADWEGLMDWFDAGLLGPLRESYSVTAYVGPIEGEDGVYWRARMSDFGMHLGLVLPFSRERATALLRLAVQVLDLRGPEEGLDVAYGGLDGVCPEVLLRIPALREEVDTFAAGLEDKSGLADRDAVRRTMRWAGDALAQVYDDLPPALQQQMGLDYERAVRDLSSAALGQARRFDALDGWSEGQLG